MSATGARSYGNGGRITIAAGQDPGRDAVRTWGGNSCSGQRSRVTPEARAALSRFQAQLIRIGGKLPPADELRLTPEFFDTGGFGSFTLTGLGAPTAVADQFTPGIYIAPGTVIAPVAESLIAVLNAPGSDGIVLQTIDLPAGQRTPVSLSFKTPESAGRMARCWSAAIL